MNLPSKLLPLFRGVLAALGLLVAHAAVAGIFTAEPRRPGTRAGRMTAYPIFQYWESQNDTVRHLSFDDLPGVVSDLTFHMSDAQLWGFGVGYDLNNHFNLNGDLMFGSPSYKMYYNNTTISGEAFVNTGQMNLDFNLLPGRFTPFITGGVGFLYLDTGIPAGPAGAWCWWDYWWGYVCTGVQPTYANTYWNLNAGAGLRYDVNDGFFLKASWNVSWIDTHNSSGWTDISRYTFSLGWKF